MNFQLPPGVKATVTDDLPLLRHVEIEYNGRKAYTTIGPKDDKDEAVAKLVATMLSIKVGTLPGSPTPVKREGRQTSVLDSKREARKARRLARKLRREQASNEED